MIVAAHQPGLCGEPAFDRFSIWGTSAVLGVCDPAALAPARARLDEILAAIEQAASRFRPGTEIIALNHAAGTGAIEVSAMLLGLVSDALAASVATGGAFDPTVAEALVALGYDRDFDDLASDQGPIDLRELRPAPGINGITVDPASSTVELPIGVHLDLGATAKARAADLGAEELAAQFHTGVLVDLGGDLRVAGSAPVGGWHIGIVPSARTHDLDRVEEVIALSAGAVASSSSAVRTWARGTTAVHHIVDPATGASATPALSLVTVAAATCVEANALSTAGIVWGEEALFELPQRSVAARLARPDGTVERIGGWPEPREALS
jgi:thiamine biosynthesis lipoprotein